MKVKAMMKFRKSIISLFTIVFVLQVVCLVPVSAADDDVYLTYIESYEGGAKVFAEASTDSKTIAKIKFGSMVNAQKLVDNPCWAKIKPTKTKSGKTISGYIFLEQFDIVRAKTQTDKTDLKSVLNATPLYPDCFFELRYDPYWREDLSILLITSSPWSIDEYDAKIKEMLAEITDGKETTYDKVKAIYDYLIENTSYDYGGYGCALSVYSVFEDGIGTCQDYNYVFMTMLRYLGLDARLAEGMTASSVGGWTGHVWVEVYINDTIYTFDPQVEDNIAGRNSGKIQYLRFGKTYAEIPGKFDKWNTRARQMFDPEELG
jgi:transglutaminase-like putative cysteine protease